MIDFHSHLLPGIDDGAKNIEESIDMLKACYREGVRVLCLTPHCYHADDRHIREFITKRNHQYRLLKEAIKNIDHPLPELRLGCELHLNKVHPKSQYLKELSIEGTNYIMLEMTMGKWDTELYDAIYSISLKGLTPLMAHIDRYYFAHADDFYNLYSLDLAYQVNCDAFLMPKIKRKMPYFFESGAIHVLGSDMHNLTTRTTHMKQCRETIKKKYGEEYYKYISENSQLILDNKPVDIQLFKKMGFLKKLKL